MAIKPVCSICNTLTEPNQFDSFYHICLRCLEIEQKCGRIPRIPKEHLCYSCGNSIDTSGEYQESLATGLCLDCLDKHLIQTKEINNGKDKTKDKTYCYICGEDITEYEWKDGIIDKDKKCIVCQENEMKKVNGVVKNIQEIMKVTFSDGVESVTVDVPLEIEEKRPKQQTKEQILQELQDNLDSLESLLMCQYHLMWAIGEKWEQMGVDEDLAVLTGVRGLLEEMKGRGYDLDSLVRFVADCYKREVEKWKQK